MLKLFHGVLDYVRILAPYGCEYSRRFFECGIYSEPSSFSWLSWLVPTRSDTGYLQIYSLNAHCGRISSPCEYKLRANPADEIYQSTCDEIPRDHNSSIILLPRSSSFTKYNLNGQVEKKHDVIPKYFDRPYGPLVHQINIYLSTSVRIPDIRVTYHKWSGGYISAAYT